MVKLSTLSRSRLLLESGALVADPVSHLVGARDLVLSRALCRFRFYRAPHALSGQQLARAARVYAEAHAPFEDFGLLIVRSAQGAGIWYWDKGKTTAHQPVRQTSPESVWREPGDGWRIVACVEGFDAQYWESGDLLASSWRRQPFSPAQWAAFAMSVDAAAVAPPSEPPDPIVLADANGAWRDKILKPPLGWGDVEKAGVSVALCGVAVAALFCGQALRSGQMAERERAQLERIDQSFRQDRDVARASEQQRLLQDYVTATRQPPVLLALTEAHEALAQFGLRSNTWRASEEGVSLIVDISVSETPMRDVLAALEEAPHLCGALPEIAGPGRFEIRADIAPDAGGECDGPDPGGGA